MKNKHSFGVLFYLRKRGRQRDKLPLYVRVTVDKRRCEFALNFKVAADDWNTGKSMAKSHTKELRLLNTQLEEIRSSIVFCYHELQQEQKPIIAETVKARYLGTDETRETLYRLMTYHNERFKDVLTPGTMKNYYSIGRYLEKFLQHYYEKHDCFLTELDYRFITEFGFFLMKHPRKEHDPLSNNGLMKHMERLKKMAHLAVSLGWLEKDPFEKYKLRFDKVEREFLTTEELYDLQHGALPTEQLKYARDLFVFSCYTGLAYCDLMDLKKDNLVIGIDHRKWIYTHRQKTKIPVRVPLLENAELILNRYKNDARTVNSPLVFRPLTNQELNRNLKILAGMFNINKHLTFHLARHTFATTVALSNGVPIETVSKLLGHTKISTTQLYARVVEQKISADMFLLNEKLKARDAFLCISA